MSNRSLFATSTHSTLCHWYISLDKISLYSILENFEFLAKIGVDASTEIVDGDLFDFDVEVQTVLESLVGRTLQQALTEVVHEEEIAELRKQQHNMLATREAELAELRRLESREKMLQSAKVKFKFQNAPKMIIILINFRTMRKLWRVKANLFSWI